MAERYEVRAENTATQEIDGEAVVINFDTYHYFGLNRTATALWTLLQGGGRDRAELADALSSAFGAMPATTAGDVDRLIEILLHEGLIEATDAVAAGGAAIEVGGDYVPPKLDRHGKLDQLMLSGE
jgi:hypothetical protein